MKIKVSSEELAQGQLSASHLQQAINAIRGEGYVILGDIVSHSHLDLLHQKMTQDSHTIVSSDKWDDQYLCVRSAEYFQACLYSHCKNR